MPSSRFRLLLAAVTAALAFIGSGLAAAPASAATGAGTITGHLSTAAGGPAGGVPVVAFTNPDLMPRHAYRTTTDVAGDYRIAAAAGTYEVGVPAGDTWVRRGLDDVVLRSGATGATSPATVVRVVTVHGILVSATSGAPVAGATVSAIGSADAMSGSDGFFTLFVDPRAMSMGAQADGWFAVQRPLRSVAGGETDLCTVAVDPAGWVDSRAGHRIDSERVGDVVDGCRIRRTSDEAAHACRDVEYWGASGLKLSPGRHTVRFEVWNPVTTRTRHVSRRVVVRQGELTDAGMVRVVADPAGRARVRATTYRAGRQIRVVLVPFFTTDRRFPHLRVTLRVNGHAVTVSSGRWRVAPNRTRTRFVATLPARWSHRADLRVQAVVHGTAQYSGQVTTTTVLRRAD